MIKKEKEKYEIDISDEEMSKMSRFIFKSLVNNKVNKIWFPIPEEYCI